MKSMQGHFLVASPHLSDPNFFRSVVLVVQHDDEGAFGLVLNRPTEKTVGDLWEMLTEEEECECEQLVHHGGPVEGPLTAIHSRSECSENEVAPGVFFSAAQENLNRLVQQSDGVLRVFMGYAGWAAGQLEAELEQGGWLSVKAAKEVVFGDQDEMWKSVVERIGHDILATSVRTKHVPSDPANN